MIYQRPTLPWANTLKVMPLMGNSRTDLSTFFTFSLFLVVRMFCFCTSITGRCFFVGGDGILTRIVSKSLSLIACRIAHRILSSASSFFPFPTGC